jgi:hypothetical protein
VHHLAFLVVVCWIIARVVVALPVMAAAIRLPLGINPRSSSCVCQTLARWHIRVSLREWFITLMFALRCDVRQPVD